MGQLTKRTHDIFYTWLEGNTVARTAQLFGCSRKRVQEIRDRLITLELQEQYELNRQYLTEVEEKAMLQALKRNRLEIQKKLKGRRS